MRRVRRAAPAGADEIEVQVASRAMGIPAANTLRRWARTALVSPKSATLTLRVVSLNEARALNSAYRGKDYATNVLTFNYGDESDYGDESRHGDQPADGAKTANRLRGDIVLCAAVVAAEARKQGKTLASHYAHLTVHGVLHMQGYDHERPVDARRMETLEIKLLAKLGYADPYR